MFFGLLLALCAALTPHAAIAGQTPLSLAKAQSFVELDEAWDFGQLPLDNATGHLIFHSVASLLQHWPNTLYRNGHSIVPGTVAPGTILYRISPIPDIPTEPDWVATDPEHAAFFCHAVNASSGCWQLTLMTTRTLKVLYFDGTSAAKMSGGTMDSQDLVIWSRLRPECSGALGEFPRIRDLCRWGRKYGLDGFVRMEMNFELMLCDFHNGAEVVSNLNLPSSDILPPLPSPEIPSPTEPEALLPSPSGCGLPSTSSTSPPSLPLPNTANVFRTTESGSWHDHYPGEHRVHLDLTRFMSFFDTFLFPSLISARAGKARWEYRLEGITEEDVQMLQQRLEDLLGSGVEERTRGSDVDWRALVRVIMTRYEKRLEILHYLLRGKPSFEHGAIMPERNWTAIAIDAHDYLGGMLNPYIVRSAVPPTDNLRSTNLSWAKPVFKACATTHTASLKAAFSSQFTRSERLILESIQATEKELCRVLVHAWADSSQLLKTHQPGSGSGCLFEDAVRRWENEISGLMDWLGWDVWVTCRPACGPEEMCYLPGWLFAYENPKLPHGPVPKYPPVEAEGRPKPFCIREVPPFTENRQFH